METVALHTRLKAGREADYDRVHATIPSELDGALREAGVHSWRIWRSGRELFHLAVEDTRLFAAGVLSAYADRRLDLEPRCRRAAILLLRDM